MLVIQPGAKDQLLDRISRSGTIEQEPGPIEAYVTVDFPLDDALLLYLVEEAKRESEGLSWPPATADSQSRHDFPANTTGRVGNIDLETQLDSASGQLYVSFTAVTSRMSRLFQQSASFERWFLDLGEQLRAAAVFLHQEAEGYRFLALQGKPTKATLDHHLDRQYPTTPTATRMLAMCQGYERLFLV